MADTQSVGTQYDAVVAAGANGTLIALMKRLTTDLSASLTSAGVQGVVADGAAIGTTKPVVIGLYDGTNAQWAAGDTSGRFIPSGPIASGAAVSGANPFVIGISNGGNVGIPGAGSGSSDALGTGSLAMLVTTYTNLFGGTNWERQRSANAAAGAAGTGVAAAGQMVYAADSNWYRALGDTTGAQKFGGFTTVVSATPTISAAAIYASGEALGGLMSLALAVRVSGGSGYIDRVTLTDLAGLAVPSTIDIVFFNANPTGSTFTDNSTFDIADADLTKVIGVVQVASADYTNFNTNDNGVYTKRAVGMPFVLATGTTLYAAMTIRTASTYVSTTDLTLSVGILQD